MKKLIVWNLVGVALGIVILLQGIGFINEPADSYYTSSVREVEFGADYYTYQYEATRVAAGNVAVAANNLREIGRAIAEYCGWGFVLGGAVLVFSCIKNCFYISYLESRNKRNNRELEQIESMRSETSV